MTEKDALFDLCISNSLAKFNTLIDGISIDYSDYSKTFEKNPVWKPRIVDNGVVKEIPIDAEFEKTYKTLQDLVKMCFSDCILDVISKFANQYKHNSKKIFPVITEISSYLEKYVDEKNFKNLYKIQKVSGKLISPDTNDFLHHLRTHGLVQQYFVLNNSEGGNVEFGEVFVNHFFINSKMLDGGKTNLNIENMPYANYYISMFFEQLHWLLGVNETNWNNYQKKYGKFKTLERKLGSDIGFNKYFLFNLVSRGGKFINNVNADYDNDDDNYKYIFNIQFLREYLICIKDLMDSIINIDVETSALDNKIKMLETKTGELERGLESVFRIASYREDDIEGEGKRRKPKSRKNKRK
jgi:hypothetical protein